MNDSIIQRLRQASKPLAKLLPRLENVGSNGDGLSARCPAHDDHANSLSVGVGRRGQVLLKCHAGCTFDEILDAFGLTPQDLFPASEGRTQRRPPSRLASAGLTAVPASTNGTAGVVSGPAAAPPPEAEPATTGLTLEQYARAKKLPVAFLTELGVSTISYLGKPAVRFAYRDSQGQVVSVRFRVALEGEGRFRYRKGMKPRPYGLDRLAAARRQGAIVLGEGESDAHTLWLFDIPALTIPGANTWNDAWADDLEGIPRIYVIVEPDRGGATLLKHLAASPLRDRLQLLRLAESVGAKDPSALYCQSPRRFRRRWRDALAQAIPWADEVRRAREAQHQQWWQQCQRLARHPRILERLARLLGPAVAGALDRAQLLYLILTTRLLEEPVSAVITGPSAAGKSYVPKQVVPLFPPEAVVELTAMSERVLAYSEEPIAHRVLLWYETAGLGGPLAQYFLRSLLTEGRLRYETLEKTPNGLKRRRIEREGPTSLLTTTTHIALHPELATRLLTIPADDTPEHTRRILAQKGAAAGGAAQTQPAADERAAWVAFQHWLASAEHRVVIPYAEVLAREIPPLAVRLRRDFPRLLTLIQAHALLHQMSRGRDAAGRIVATLADYAVVRRLVRHLMAEALEVEVAPEVRDTVEAVARLGATQPALSVTELARQLALDVSTVSRRVQVALHLGYLENLSAGRGRAFQLVVGKPLPTARPLLPHPRHLSILYRREQRRQPAASRSQAS
jgi:hypothetical protein